MAADSILEPEEEPISLDGDEEPISLVESSDDSAAEGLALKTIGAAANVTETKFTRPLNADGSGATRFRIFHSKISLAPLENLEHSINEWIDGDKIEVKHVGQLIGTMEGKRPEPNLLVLVWY
jgi:hypothetical protein